MNMDCVKQWNEGNTKICRHYFLSFACVLVFTVPLHARRFYNIRQVKMSLVDIMAENYDFVFLLATFLRDRW